MNHIQKGKNEASSIPSRFLGAPAKQAVFRYKKTPKKQVKTG